MSDVLTVGEAGVAPDVVRATRQAKHVNEPRACEGERQAGLVGFIRDYMRQSDGRELWQMRDDANRPVMSLRVAPDRLCADASQ